MAVVLDLYSRRVVDWSMQTQMAAQGVIDAMLMAIWRRGPKQAFLHYCDRGSQYSSEDFQRLISAHGVSCSRSRHSTLDYVSPAEFERMSGLC